MDVRRLLPCLLLALACDGEGTLPSLTFAVGGTASGVRGELVLVLNDDERLVLTGDGAFTFATPLSPGQAWQVTVAETPRTRRCLVTNGSGVMGNAARSDVVVECSPFYAFTTYQPASRVLGQPDFTSALQNRGAGPGADGFNRPWGNPAFAGGRLWISDYFNNRVLGFDGVPESGASAKVVLGQAGLNAGAQPVAPTATTLRSPGGVLSDGAHFGVVDAGSSRVVFYDGVPDHDGAAARLVVGKPDLESMAFDCDAATTLSVEGAYLGHGKLMIADAGHNRVLIWNEVPLASGVPADLVLGQTSMTTCEANDADADGESDETPSPSTMSYPTGVWFDGIRLFVADFGNTRVLVWNALPTRHGQPADFVLGNEHLQAGPVGLDEAGPDRFPSPYFVLSTGTQLFVSEWLTNRILVWNEVPTTSGTAPDVVLGQPDFTSVEPRDVDTGSVSARTLAGAGGLLLVEDVGLVTVDYDHHRALVFESK